MNTELTRETRTRGVEALYATGHWLLEEERFADAADVFRAMVTVAPEDERGWIALGTCHEGAEHLVVAREMYATGCMLAKPAGRCAIALARVLRKLGEDQGATEVIDAAEEMAAETDDDGLAALVAHERRRS